MRIRLFLRAFFTITTLAVVWFVTSPALAAGAPMSMLHPPIVDDSVLASSRAPLCDPRGATMFAPPPQMQDVELTLDTGLTLDDCMTAPLHDANRAVPGGHSNPNDASASGDSVSDRVITTLAALAAAARELVPVPSASTTCPRPGVRSTVDRPPRV